MGQLGGQWEMVGRGPKTHSRKSVLAAEAPLPPPPPHIELFPFGFCLLAVMLAVDCVSHPLNSYVEALTLIVMVFADGAFGR